MKKRIKLVIGTLFILGLFQNCGKVRFSPDNKASNDDVIQEQNFKKFKPALSGRALSCTMCHANVNSDIITDFGAGNSYYLSGTIYTPEEGWPQFNGVQGQIRFPKSNLPSSLTTSARKTLSDLLIEKLGSLVTGDQLKEMKSVYIGAPTAAQILTKTPGVGTKNWYYKKSSDGRNLSGLVRANSPDPSVKNSGELVCDGDLVVNGPLLLKNLSLNTRSGCRIYVTGPIFVNGSISFVDQTALSNIQLVSARGIFLGFSHGTLTVRLRTDNRNTQFKTRVAENNVRAELDSIISIAEQIPDLSNPNDDSARTDIHFERILINAPQIHSRYQGLFQGAVIGEVVIFRLNLLHFAFDSVFTQVPVLPLTGISQSLRIVE